MENLVIRCNLIMFCPQVLEVKFKGGGVGKNILHRKNLQDVVTSRD